ncbi:uncharacterized protein LOC6555354 [Drosophila erecta]|uniref:uncharacterized protein LOC6555354 n=1 Tax=Drosophila erecta TaxID=7220 RepID=UPI000F05314F|nr:uncharacterized protein LOC6555354 [Drosophila erecta]
MDAGGVTLSGNATLRWAVQPEDRVEVISSLQSCGDLCMMYVFWQMSGKLLYMDRGTWTPTVFSLTAKDFCTVMFDKNQLWYKYWTAHITNEVKNCLNVPGTKIIHEKYVLSLTATAVGPVTPGRYKANLMFRAYDSSGAERPTRICVEVRGDLSKVRRSKPFA